MSFIPSELQYSPIISFSFEAISIPPQHFSSPFVSLMLPELRPDSSLHSPLRMQLAMFPVDIPRANTQDIDKSRYEDGRENNSDNLPEHSFEFGFLEGGMGWDGMGCDMI